MRRVWFGLLILGPLAAASSQAQDRPQGPPPPPPSSWRILVERQFADRVGQALQLTDDQKKRLATVTEQFAQQRKALRTREKALRRALADQLQPGVAANDDSISKLTTSLVDLRVRFAESSRDELKEVSKFLTPVQRARLFTMRERLYHAVDERMGAGSHWEARRMPGSRGALDRSAEMHRLALRLRNDSDWHQLRRRWRTMDTTEQYRQMHELLRLMDSTRRTPAPGESKPAPSE